MDHSSLPVLGSKARNLRSAVAPMNSTPPAAMFGPPALGVPVFGTPFAVNSLYSPNGTRQIILQEVPRGQGGILGQCGGVDYHAYIAEVSKAGVPLLQEHWTTNEESQVGDRYIRKVAAELGVPV
ncbi:hypothetical protein SBA3_1090017 [Candidatus Sulfopaludibacter sp. SbA3]|nr:hypothetical protein SBA3_1090017 [Candidatus Sulfopaludibacter sp. SbA3]